MKIRRGGRLPSVLLGQGCNDIQGGFDVYETDATCENRAGPSGRLSDLSSQDLVVKRIEI